MAVLLKGGCKTNFKWALGIQTKVKDKNSAWHECKYNIKTRCEDGIGYSNVHQLTALVHRKAERL